MAALERVVQETIALRALFPRDPVDGDQTRAIEVLDIVDGVGHVVRPVHQFRFHAPDLGGEDDIGRVDHPARPRQVLFLGVVRTPLTPVLAARRPAPRDT